MFTSKIQHTVTTSNYNFQRTNIVIATEPEYPNRQFPPTGAHF